jgi:5-methylcytosine-specific restriction endonuclease McrA
MRYILKDFKNPPPILVGGRCVNQITQIINSQRGGDATYYNKKEVVDALNDLYKNKCGFCESRIHVVASENVEHYRPKAGVDPVDLVKGTTHIGYYWLANEWSNLLIACPKCNQKGHKGNRFPLRNPNSRISNHPVLLANGSADIAANNIRSSHIRNENALLLNPELTMQPEEHFNLQQDGRLENNNDSEYADYTIEVCKLNRDPLKKERKKIIDKIVSGINKQILEWTKDIDPLTEIQFRRQLNIIFDEIITRLYDDREYTFVAKMIIKNFETIILNQFEVEFQTVVLNQFTNYLKSNNVL